MAEIIKLFPRKLLGYFPSPIVDLPRLTSALDGPRILIKRDDHTGLGMGGNKIRKLEFLCGQAVSAGCDSLVTAGAIQSNHCRITAAAAAQVGLKCHLLLGGNEPRKEDVSGNLLLNCLFGAEIHWAGAKRKGEDLEKLCEGLKKKGGRPYLIPYGGSNSIGALGYVNAMLEIMTQVKAAHIKLDAIVFASSSGGTHAGLMTGAALSNYKGRIIGIRIDKEERTDFASQVDALFRETMNLCQVRSRKSTPRVELKEDYLGKGYAVIGELETNAIKLLAQKEGILVDPVYTGRAMGGLLDLIKKKELKKGETVMFLHTGGLPALFCYNKELLG